jgi:hypothetical protein
MDASRITIAVVVSSLVSGGVGYALGTSSTSEAPTAAPEPYDEPLADDVEPALAECETRLAAAEVELVQRAQAGTPVPIDPASLPEPERALIASPTVVTAIEREVERRIAARFERERARREAEWAARRAEIRARLREIGIDDEALERVTPAMCAMRDMFRQARSEGRAARSGDGGVRVGRREMREQMRPLRDEVASTLGDERMARLEDEGGMRALGAAVECGDDGPRGGEPARPR